MRIVGGNAELSQGALPRFWSLSRKRMYTNLHFNEYVVMNCGSSFASPWRFRNTNWSPRVCGPVDVVLPCFVPTCRTQVLANPLSRTFQNKVCPNLLGCFCSSLLCEVRPSKTTSDLSAEALGVVALPAFPLRPKSSS